MILVPSIFFYICFLLCNPSYALVPDDTLFPQQWAFQAINAPSGWDNTTGSSEVIIAVLNSGIDPNFNFTNTDNAGTYDWWQDGSVRGHPDLNPVDANNANKTGSKVWVNTKEIPADGIDNDQNGYPDDVHGVNLIVTTDKMRRDSKMYKNEPYDDSFVVGQTFGMGTRISGIIGAITNNKAGIAGTAWNCKIMPVRVVESNGAATAGSIEAGIKYAADHGAKVILLPIPFRDASPKYRDWKNLDWSLVNNGVQYAHKKGCVIISPVGNSGTAAEEYASTFENVIGVGSVKKTGTGIGSVDISSFSNRNKYVDVVAPGEDILSTSLCNVTGTTYGNGSYESFSDTSAAAAFAAGFAGILFSKYPQWSNTMVEEQIIFSALPLPDQNITRGYNRNDQYGYGLIDLSASTFISEPVTPTVNKPVPSTIFSSQTLTGTMAAYPFYSRKILVNASDEGVSYTSATSWSAKVTLTKGINKISVTAKNANGIESGPATVEVELNTMTFSDSKGNNQITFLIDSTSQIPTATVEVYNGPELGLLYGASKISNAINIISSVDLISGKTAVITLKTAESAPNPKPYYWDETSKSWKNNGLTVIANNADSVTFTSTRTSGIFAIFRMIEDLNNILIYPIPYRIGSTDTNGVVFDYLQGDEVIKIYTLTGEMVYDSNRDYKGARSWTWQAKNLLDYNVSQDVYYYYITNVRGQKRIGKIVVLN